MEHLARTVRRHGGSLRLAGVHPPQLHAVHQRHHRQAQGRAARHRRLRRSAGRQHGAYFLHQAGRDLFLHQRHRLGGGALLHRLRPADRRHGDHSLRGPTDPATWWHLVGAGAKVPRHRDVQRPHRRARAQKAGPCALAPVRPVQPARAVSGGRAAGRAHRAVDQRRPGQSHHRQLLADRERLAHPHLGQRRGEAKQQIRQPRPAHVRLQRQAVGQRNRRRAARTG